MTQTRWWTEARALHCLLFVTLVLVVVPLLPAQEGPPPASTEPAPQPVPDELRSARATMRTFLDAFYQEDGALLDHAAACLDLSAIPANIRQTRGRELAADLKGVIDRTRFVRFEAIPDDPQAPPWVFLRRAEGEVVINRSENGSWLFSRSTVAQIDALRRATEAQNVVDGVEEFARSVSPSMWLRERVPDSFRRPFIYIEIWQWIGLLAVILIGVVVDRIFLGFARVFLIRLIRRRLERVDERLLTRALKPAAALVMVLVWWVGMGFLGLPVKVLRLYADAVWVVLVLAACATAYRSVTVVADALQKRAEGTESRADDLLVPLIRKSLKVLIVAVGIVLVADALNQNLTGLVAGLGLGGLAFALAAKDTVGNLFGSLTVLLDRPFHVGDWVVVGDVEGTVEEVGFRSTRIRTFYNSLITLPNSNLTSAAVDNLGVRSYRRWSTRLGLAYDTPPEKIDAFCEGLRELILRHPHTRKDYFHVYLNEFGDSALEILLYVFFETPDWGAELRERHRLAVDITRLAAKLEVDFAFPSQTVYLRQETARDHALPDVDYPEGSRKMAAEARRQARELTQNAVEESTAPPTDVGDPGPGD